MTANEKDIELAHWGDCCNTYCEETKQWVYARLMGIRREHWSLRVYGASIIDIGGGPVSMLLKCHDLGRGLVADPLLHDYPAWVSERYRDKGITPMNVPGEASLEFLQFTFDEAWIYNVLQHVDDPALVVKNALAVCRKLRIFEWIDVDPYPGHPHKLTEAGLNDWLGTSGDTIPLSYEACHGLAYVNVVEGKAK